MSLNQACRLLHVVAQPFLYHSFQITAESDLPFFLRTLLDRPDLASKVFEVGLYQHDLILLMITRRALRLMGVHITAPIDALPLPHARRLQDIHSRHATPRLEHMRDGMELVEVLLHLAPNVQSCHVRLPSEEYVGDAALTSSSTYSFASLKRLAFSSFNGNFILDHAPSVLQRAPNLDSLHCHRCSDVSKLFSVTLGQRTLAGSPPLQNLTGLNLTSTLMTATSLRNLLKTIGPKLSKVSIQAIETDIPELNPGGNTVKFGETVLALQRWKDKLKVLRFTNDKMDLAPPETSYLGGIYALHYFQALETIEAPARSFDFYGQLGDQQDALALTLPASVRELRLPGFPEKVQLAPSLRGLARALRAGQFGRLRQIGIDSKHFEVGESEQDAEAVAELKEVVALFRSLGVELSALS